MAYASMKKKHTELVHYQSMKLPKVKRADFTFKWYCKDRRKDKDNIISGMKFIFDGLVNAGVIENDGWNQVGDINNTFEVDKDNPRVEVIIKRRKKE